MGNKIDNPHIVSWEEPTKKVGRKQSKWAPVAEQLRINPGRWAKIVENDNVGVATEIRQGKLRCFQPQGSFEAVVENLSSGGSWTGDVYARYIGDNGEYK